MCIFCVCFSYWACQWTSYLLFAIPFAFRNTILDWTTLLNRSRTVSALHRPAALGGVWLNWIASSQVKSKFITLSRTYSTNHRLVRSMRNCPLGCDTYWGITTSTEWTEGPLGRAGQCKVQYFQKIWSLPLIFFKYSSNIHYDKYSSNILQIFLKARLPITNVIRNHNVVLVVSCPRVSLYQYRGLQM